MNTALLSALVLLASATPQSAESAPTVHIKNDAFSPETLTVQAGAAVRFVNDDDDAHTVSADDRTFDSKGIDTHGSWQHVFRKPGTYAYFCEVHPFMKGRIVVTAVAP